jgi:hypothetical protein
VVLSIAEHEGDLVETAQVINHLQPAASVCLARRLRACRGNNGAQRCPRACCGDACRPPCKTRMRSHVLR